MVVAIYSSLATHGVDDKRMTAVATHESYEVHIVHVQLPLANCLWLLCRHRQQLADLVVVVIAAAVSTAKQNAARTRLRTITDSEDKVEQESSDADVGDKTATLQLSDLRRVATLGIGTFGRVQLVSSKCGEMYALKVMSKQTIVDNGDQERIFIERDIMLKVKSDWFVRLHRTFVDSRYVYMLMDVCMGGELWKVIRDRLYFDKQTARFYAASVTEALGYLHQNNIVYRDLKPENCLLSANGYLKLVDFGFAKQLDESGRTTTFCGTPEYVPPEIILRKDHGLSVDCWALGVFVYEMLTGRPPFQSTDVMKLYVQILKGVGALAFPERLIDDDDADFIRALCRHQPIDRLGHNSPALQSVKQHAWFAGFEWNLLRSGKMKAPILPAIDGNYDLSNFGRFPQHQQDEAPEEFSGWDETFEL